MGVSLCSQKVVTLSIDGGSLRLRYGKLQDAQGCHCVLQRRRLRGEVLALAFKAQPKPCILVLAQHRWMRRLALMGLDWKLQPLFTLPMEEVPPWPCGRSSAWLWDLPGQGALVALGHPGVGSPPTSLHKLQLPTLRPDTRWLTGSEALGLLPGKVQATLRLESPVLVAAQAVENTPVVLGSDELRFLSTSTLRTVGSRHALRQSLSSLSLTAGRPKDWSPMAVAAAGQQVFAFLGYASGPPQILQLKVTSEVNATISCSLLRLVGDFAALASPIYQVLPFEANDAVPGTSPCGFLAFNEQGSSCAVHLDFSFGPLEAPSAIATSRSPAKQLKSRLWNLGEFWPKTARGHDLALAILNEESLHLWSSRP